jgi:hypothetical protein
MEEKRRFKRVPCNEKIFVEFDDEHMYIGKLLNLSLNGALIELGTDTCFKIGDIWHLTFKLENSKIFLQFRAEVVHHRNNQVGVKIVHIDVETMLHLRSLVEARTSEPEQIGKELEFLYELNKDTKKTAKKSP